MPVSGMTMISLPVRIGALTALVLALAIALVVMLDALSFAKARADAQRATVGWAVHELVTAAEAGLARGVPLASTAETMDQQLRAALAEERTIGWIALADRDGRFLSGVGQRPGEWPEDLLRAALRPAGVTTITDHHGLVLLLAPLNGVSEREGVLAIGYDSGVARADAAAFTTRLAWLALVIWGAASALLIALLAWAARPHLGQLRRMELALAGTMHSGDADLDATLDRVRSVQGGP